MLTVRMIYPNNNEYVIEAESVSRIFTLSDDTNPPSKIESVKIEQPGNCGLYIYEGAVYVMNEAGKTVASYILGQKITEKTE